MNNKEIYNNLMEKNGDRHQIIKAVEELAELSVELTKYLNGLIMVTSPTIIDELADVSIMLDQMILFFDRTGKVQARKYVKLKILSGIKPKKNRFSDKANCSRGHEFTKLNTALKLRKDGTAIRICKECLLIKKAENLKIEEQKKKDNIITVSKLLIELENKEAIKDESPKDQIEDLIRISKDPARKEMAIFLMKKYLEENS